MGSYKDNDFNERRKSAANANRTALEKFRARPGPDDPIVMEKQAARKAISDAREIRIAERKAAREAEAARQAAEQANLVAERIAREAEQVAQAAERAARDEAKRAEQKAARDARYAARKARR
ncbi:MAG: DUF6481 family protein [Pseudomonadota bacterium]|nr:DUF6481 family protein [Pseudomonadota bacterium]